MGCQAPSPAQRLSPSMTLTPISREERDCHSMAQPLAARPPTAPASKARTPSSPGNPRAGHRPLDSGTLWCWAPIYLLGTPKSSLCLCLGRALETSLENRKQQSRSSEARPATNVLPWLCLPTPARWNGAAQLPPGPWPDPGLWAPEPPGQGPGAAHSTRPQAGLTAGGQLLPAIASPTSWPEISHPLE